MTNSEQMLGGHTWAWHRKNELCATSDDYKLASTLRKHLTEKIFLPKMSYTGKPSKSGTTVLAHQVPKKVM